MMLRDAEDTEHEWWAAKKAKEVGRRRRRITNRRRLANKSGVCVQRAVSQSPTVAGGGHQRPLHSNTTLHYNLYQKKKL